MTLNNCRLHETRFDSKFQAVKRNGLELSFGCALDPASATDLQNFSVAQWNYRWIERYGSPHYSVANPELQGHDAVEIRAVRLSEDRQTLFLEIPKIQPVMQMRIAYNLTAADGASLRQEIYNTINRVPND